MFGRGSYSSTSFSGSYGKLYAQAINVTTTVTASITKAITNLKTLLVSVSNIISIKKAISITLTQILDTVIVVLSTVGKHLVSMSIQVSNTVALNRLLSLSKLLTTSVTNIVTLFTHKFINKLISIVVTNTVIKKIAVNKFVVVLVNVIPKITKALQRLLIALITSTTASIVLGFVSRFGAIARNTYYANERIRTMVISKVRTLFANEGDRNG